jgi:hypothetical protein
MLNALVGLMENESCTPNENQFLIVSQKSFVPHLPAQRWDKTFLEIYIIVTLGKSVFFKMRWLLGKVLAWEEE